MEDPSHLRIHRLLERLYHRIHRFLRGLYEIFPRPLERLGEGISRSLGRVEGEKNIIILIICRVSSGISEGVGDLDPWGM